MEKFEFTGESGPTQNFKHIHDQTEKLLDTAAEKSAVIASAKAVVDALGQTERFKLGRGQRDVLGAFIEKEIVDETRARTLDELKAIAAKAVNDGLSSIGLEMPGFANLFNEALKDKMTIH